MSRDPSSINYELYKVFYTVTKTMNFSKAAKALYMTQSAVSQNIRQLEDRLGVSLFGRSTKQVFLTQDGLKLLEHIEPAIHMIQSGENYIQETKALKRGQLHIGASDTICKHYLLDYFKSFHQKYPHVELKVTNRTSFRCVELLNQGRVDLIVTNLPNSHLTPDMAIRKTLSFNDVFIASHDRPLKHSPLTLDELSQEPILMLTKETATSEYLYQLFNDANLNISPSIELGSIDLLVALASINLGISFVPSFCVPKDSHLRIIDTVDSIPSRQLGIATHTKRPLTEASKRFIELLMES